MPRYDDVVCRNCGTVVASVRIIPATRIDPPDYDGEIPPTCPRCDRDTHDAEWRQADEQEIEYTGPDDDHDRFIDESSRQENDG